MQTPGMEIAVRSTKWYVDVLASALVTLCESPRCQACFLGHCDHPRLLFNVILVN